MKEELDSAGLKPLELIELTLSAAAEDREINTRYGVLGWIVKLDVVAEVPLVVFALATELRL